MKLILLILLLAAPAAFSQTNTITAPGGDVYLTTSDAGFYWTGFIVAFGFYVFGIILSMSRRVGGYCE